MFSLLSLCDLGTFPWLLLWWLLPFLLGWLLGHLLNGKWRTRVTELEEENRRLRVNISGLEKDLEDCRSGSGLLKNEIAMLKGRVRELEMNNEADVAKLSAVAPSVSSPPTKNIYAGLKEDNLQVIEGIGPKMESILHEKGINTWTRLAAQSSGGLRELLDSYGSKYKIIDPTTWPQQAALARDGNWEELIARQKDLSAGRLDVGDGATDSKVEKMLIKLGVLKRWTKDDLKAIEGIGPKIEGLLDNADIKTWEALANASVERIQRILDDAGDRYKLADPGTWPRQARLAADGKWDELDEYQEFLQGGKE